MNSDILSNNADNVVVQIINNRIYLTGSISRETASGVLVKHSGGETWFPKREICLTQTGITMKPWLAEKRGYVRSQPRSVRHYRPSDQITLLPIPDQVADSIEFRDYDF